MALDYNNLTVQQQIHIWGLVTGNRPAVEKFFNEVSYSHDVELPDGTAKMVAVSENANDIYSDDEEPSWVVFSHGDKLYKIERSGYSSWDDDYSYDGPFEVVGRPVNEVQYFKV